jgi:hypothetical protein
MPAIGLGINLGMGIGAIPYLFRDEFTTSESAPIASPRTAEPGPGTLTCVQTDGELSIVGGAIRPFGSRKFDGTGMFDVANNANIDLSTNIDFFTAGWIKSNDITAGWETLVAKWTGGGNHFYCAKKSGIGTVEFGVRNAGGPATNKVLSSSNLVNGVWSFIMCYYDASTTEAGISIDGGAFVTGTVTGGVLLSQTGDLSVGGYGEAQQIDGFIDEVAFGKPADVGTFKNAIRDSLYNSGSGKQYADLTAAEKSDWGLEAYYPCNEGFGGTALGNLLDAHGTNHMTDDANPILAGQGIDLLTRDILVFPVQATPTWADQGYHTGSIARAAGTLISSQINVDLATKTVSATCQKTASLASAQRQYELGFSNTDLNKWADDGIGGLQVGDFVAATDYQVLFVLRATGAHFLIKGGIYTDWTLLWVDANGSAAVFCGLSNYNASGTQEYFRVRAALWTPTPLASDSFDRANSISLGSTDGAGSEESGGSGLAWTKATAGAYDLDLLVIQSNALVSTDATNARNAVATIDASNADVLIQASLTPNAWASLVLRWQDFSNLWNLEVSSSNRFTLMEGSTQRAQATPTINAGTAYDVVAVLDDETITCYLDGTNRISYGSASAHKTKTVHGVWLDDAYGGTEPKADNFVVWPRNPTGVPDDA